MDSYIIQLKWLCFYNQPEVLNRKSVIFAAVFPLISFAVSHASYCSFNAALFSVVFSNVCYWPLASTQID